MKRNIQVYIEDIFESIAKIEQYLKDTEEEKFFDDSQIQDSVLRRLEVIGEAAKNVPHDFREKYPDIPWKKIAGLRDVLIHEYFGVNFDRVWKIAKEDLPNLKEKVSEIRNQFAKDQQS